MKKKGFVVFALIFLTVAVGTIYQRRSQKELLGENQSYSVYLVSSNSSRDEPEKTGEIVIYDKNRTVETKMVGKFSFSGSTIVTDDNKGKYILLSTGTYILRSGIVLSLHFKKQVAQICIGTNKQLFWNDSLIYDNCDREQNRPWGAGEAPSIEVVNLKTGQTNILFKSDSAHQFTINNIEGNILSFKEESVSLGSDWNLPGESRKKVSRTYDLSILTE